MRLFKLEAFKNLLQMSQTNGQGQAKSMAKVKQKCHKNPR